MLGARHPRTLRGRRQHAELLHHRGDAATAIAELEAALAAMRAVHGDDHARVREAAELLTAWRGASGS